VNRDRAVYFQGPGVVSVRDVSLPACAPTGQVRVTSTLIGISHGTEMMIFEGHLPEAQSADATLSSLDCPMRYPLRYGYSTVGRMSDGGHVFAFYPHQTSFWLPASETVALPPGLADDDAVFLASTETALTICHDALPVAGDCVLVVGQGVIGLLVAEILSAYPLLRVVTLEPLASRRRASAALGCLALDPADAGTPAALADAAGGRGFDVAINVSADGAGLQAAIDALAFGGTVVEASYYGSRHASLELGRSFHRKRLSIRSSQVSTADPRLAGRWNKTRRLAAALELVRRIRPGRYITHRFALEDAQSAFELIRDRPGEVLQVVLDPSPARGEV
jgi:threonine dehydrogenase-like Zn-dependent dehydrogenase